MSARRLRRALLGGSVAVAGLTVVPALSSAAPAMAVGPYATCTASPPASDAPPSDVQCPPPPPPPTPGTPSNLPPPSPELPPEPPYTYSGSSTYRASGYYYTY